MKDRSLIKSFNYAIDGIVYVLRNQRNMRIHFFLAILVLGLGLILNLSRIEFIVLFFVIALVVVSELINTAIESTIDLVTTTYDPIAEVAKNVAAASVLVASATALIVGYLVFFHRLNPYTLALLQKIRQAPVHLTVITLILVVILVIAAKAWTASGKFLRGGWPSGHSALAGALFTAIVFISSSPLIAALGLALALLVFHSRLESGIHSAVEILSGAILGVLVAVLVFQVLNI
jgi:diacylglycerol kinase (ATP)